MYNLEVLSTHMALWRSGYAAVCKTAYAGSIPVGASRESGGIGIHDGLKIRCRKA
jgi:hypothetical protein